MPKPKRKKMNRNIPRPQARTAPLVSGQTSSPSQLSKNAPPARPVTITKPGDAAAAYASATNQNVGTELRTIGIITFIILAIIIALYFVLR